MTHFTPSTYLNAYRAQQETLGLDLSTDLRLCFHFKAQPLSYWLGDIPRESISGNNYDVGSRWNALIECALSIKDLVKTACWLTVGNIEYAKVRFYTSLSHAEAAIGYIQHIFNARLGHFKVTKALFKQEVFECFTQNYRFANISNGNPTTSLSFDQLTPLNTTLNQFFSLSRQEQKQFRETHRIAVSDEELTKVNVNLGNEIIFSHPSILKFGVLSSEEFWNIEISPIKRETLSEKELETLFRFQSLIPMPSDPVNSADEKLTLHKLATMTYVELKAHSSVPANAYFFIRNLGTDSLKDVAASDLKLILVNKNNERNRALFANISIEEIQEKSKAISKLLRCLSDLHLEEIKLSELDDTSINAIFRKKNTEEKTHILGCIKPAELNYMFINNISSLELVLLLPPEVVGRLEVHKFSNTHLNLFILHPKLFQKIAPQEVQRIIEKGHLPFDELKPVISAEQYKKMDPSQYKMHDIHKIYTTAEKFSYISPESFTILLKDQKFLSYQLEFITPEQQAVIDFATMSCTYLDTLFPPDDVETPLSQRMREKSLNFIQNCSAAQKEALQVLSNEGTIAASYFNAVFDLD